MDFLKCSSSKENECKNSKFQVYVKTLTLMVNSLTI